MITTEIYIVIATSLRRTELLLTRSLPSVYRQERVNSEKVQVIIIDDNQDDSELRKIEDGVLVLRRNMQLQKDDFSTMLIKNSRSHFMSGSGAWNTGINYVYLENPCSYIAILDDDDEYLPNHLFDCCEILKENHQTLAVFQELIWKMPDGNVWPFPLAIQDFTPVSFYKGNPGVQGSNMFIRADALKAIDSFDESFQSTTDRDLMIRFLQYVERNYNIHEVIQIIQNPGIIHYEHTSERVTSTEENKRAGLNRFYEKFRGKFSDADYFKSLRRAELLFNYKPAQQSAEKCIVVLMAAHNNEDTVERAINSVVRQKQVKRKLLLLISDDTSLDKTASIARRAALENDDIILFDNKFGNAAKNRNWLQEYVKTNFQNCDFICRLDADDELANPLIISQIEQLFESEKFDVLLMANHQCIMNKITSYINKPEPDLANPEILMSRLKILASGIWEAELPSCNVVVRPNVAIPYPQISSAEDHWNLTDYLLNSGSLRFLIRPDWIYCNYSIDKYVKTGNKNKSIRQKSRKELYKYALTKIEENMRIQKALEILNRYKESGYSYLGAGFSGVVFRDNEWVYKVHLPLSTNNYGEVDNVLFLMNKLELFHGRKHFFALKELVTIEGVNILIYPYEKGEKVNTVSKSDMISFLSEMWQLKVICRSITKENNFIRVNGVIKLIDYEFEPYDDNLFLNMAARAFIQLNEILLSHLNYNKLKRSTINNFNLPELDRFYPFVEEIFISIAQSNSGKIVRDQVNIASPALTIYDGRQNPKVALLIKACIQDAENLYNNVKHIVSQLSQSVAYSERTLLLDVYKKKDFLREYSSNGSLKMLRKEADRLVSDGWIDRHITASESDEDIIRLNARWFSVPHSFTHTHKGVPVTSQLFAFESVNVDYLLQMDVDVLIGRKNESHDFLKYQIAQLEANPKAVTIGFQIYHEQNMQFQEFSGYDGSLAPDVRCCLINRSMLMSIRPLPNAVNEKGWELSWYRALEKLQSSKGHFSLRGGDTDTFYIHPQNYRKANRKVWWKMIQSVENGLVHDKQIGQPEVAGNHFDWCLPKRNEELVVVVYFDEYNLDEWTNTLQNLSSQNHTACGWVIINNCGHHQPKELFTQLVGSLMEKCTLINNEYALPFNEAIYDALHYYLTDQDSFVCIIRQGDVLLYPDLLRECMNRLKTYGADVLLGKELSQWTLQKHGKSISNFLHPRRDPESLANGLVVFRKYLFDSLSHFDLKEEVKGASRHIAAFNKIRLSHKWMNDPTMLSIVVPMVEMSSNPIRFDHYNLLRKKAITHEKLAQVVDFLQSKSPRTEGNLEKGRKTFLPNTSKIELDITYQCNLKCFHCNRSCTQAPTDVHMTLEQVSRFVKESINLGKQWQLINVLGGEPTLHPQFDDIVHCLLYDYIVPHSPDTTLQITSNGYGEQVQQKLKTIPHHPNLVIHYDSFKEDRAIPYFTPFNLAPQDEPDSRTHEYHKGCWVTAYCGIGLNHLGYFACGVAGGIERILRAGKGIQGLAEMDGHLQNQLNTYCRLCGNFTAYAENRGDFMERAEKDTPPKKAMSISWEQLYTQHHPEYA